MGENKGKGVKGSSYDELSGVGTSQAGITGTTGNLNTHGRDGGVGMPPPSDSGNLQSAERGDPDGLPALGRGTRSSGHLQPGGTGSGQDKEAGQGQLQAGAGNLQSGSAQGQPAQPQAGGGSQQSGSTQGQQGQSQAGGGSQQSGDAGSRSRAERNAWPPGQPATDLGMNAGDSDPRTKQAQDVSKAQPGRADRDDL